MRHKVYFCMVPLLYVLLLLFCMAYSLCLIDYIISDLEKSSKVKLTKAMNKIAAILCMIFLTVGGFPTVSNLRKVPIPQGDYLLTENVSPNAPIGIIMLIIFILLSQ